jgi:hypothetical protein
VDRENIGTGIGVSTYDDAFPDNPQEQEAFQSDVGNHALSRISGVWVPGLSSVNRCVLAANLTAGLLVMPSVEQVGGFPSVAACTSAKRTSAIGVLCMDGNNGENGLYVVRGPALVQVASAIAAGAPVRQSATAGQIESAGAAGTGYGREVIGTALTADSGGFAWVNLRAR